MADINYRHDGLSPRFLVIQNGARHGYAIPAALERQGALAGLYTDFASNCGAGKMLATTSVLSRYVAPKLLRRSLPENLLKVSRTFEFSFAIAEVLRRVIPNAQGTKLAETIKAKIAERSMIAAGMMGATHIYTMLGEGGNFIADAKRRGLGIVGDVYIALSSDAIVHEEMRNFPDWCGSAPFDSDLDDSDARNHILLTQSDLFVCPSDFVLEDLIVNHGVDREKCVVAPYAVDQRWFLLECDPIPRRVLFAGSAIVRKGIHYLAMAAERLAPYGYKFVVAGGATPLVRHHPNATALEFCGQLQSSELGEQLRRADVFAFPTLAEGAASAVAEALGAGVPVVTTRAAGSIVRDGVEGFIVPERDPIALAHAIQTISEDRDLRARMSEAAKIRAARFTWDHFSTTVLSAVQ